FRLHRGWGGAHCRGGLSAALLGARGAVGAADPDRDAFAAAHHQGPSDRAAVSSCGGRRPARAPLEMNSPAPSPRRGMAVPIVFTLAAVAGLVALGTWQLERKAWKDGLIAALEEKLAAPPVALPLRERWPKLSAEMDEFRRVRFAAE